MFLYTQFVYILILISLCSHLFTFNYVLSFCFRQLKSVLIGSNKAKNRIIEAGVVPRLLNLLTEPTLTDLKVAVAYALGSIAKGSEAHLKVLLDCDIVAVLLNSLVASREPRFVEACLCCLRTLFYHPEAPVDVLYADPALISHLLVSF